jgi:hypothetical protein
MGAIRLLVSSLVLLSALQAHADVTTGRSLADLLPNGCEFLLTKAEIETLRPKWQGKTIIFAPDVLLKNPDVVHLYPGTKVVISAASLEQVADQALTGGYEHAAHFLYRKLESLIANADSPASIEIGLGSTLTFDSQKSSALLYIGRNELNATI